MDELQNEDYASVLRDLRSNFVHIPISAIKAVSDVLSLNKGFDRDDLCIIHYDRSTFYGHMKKCKTPDEIKSLKSEMPRIIGCYSSEPVSNEEEHENLALARSVHNEFALRSTRWGMYQISGDDVNRCGYSSVDEFAAAMRRSRKDQLLMLGKYIKSNFRLCTALDRLDWKEFMDAYTAYPYNKEGMDKKLDAFYRMHKAMS